MPIKLINSDAKGFLSKVVCELTETERLVPPGTPMPEKIQAAVQQIKNVRLMAEGWLANQMMWNESEESPKLISDPYTSPNGDWNGNKFHNIKVRGKLVLFKNALFDVTGLCTKEEAKLLVVKNYEAERSEIDFLKSRSDKSSEKLKTGREPIPERIRNEVWRRDGGKCVECGSVYNLEFDHVIPVAKGGSNTARNLRILCEPCNRRKSDSIG
jgi:HNH endonuclease